MSLIDVVVSATLILAAVSKIVSPVRTRVAVGEVAPVSVPVVTDVAVRLFAACELIVAALLFTTMTRVLGGWLVAAFGVLFAAAGTAGLLRGATRSCGCLGGYGDKPLGVRNIVIGVAMAVTAPINMISIGVVDASEYARGMLILSAFLLLNSCLWMNRATTVPLATLGRGG